MKLQWQNLDKIFLHRDFVDGRRGIDGLVSVVQFSIKVDPFSSSLFIFCNKGRNRLRILYWDRTGFALWLKRLEKERFPWPSLKNSDPVLNLKADDLDRLLDGYNIWKIKPHKTLEYCAFS